jgi:hypothetical protein
VNIKKSRHSAVSFMHFGAKKCWGRLLRTNRLSLLLVLYSKTRNAKNAAGNIQTHIAFLVGQRLQTKKPNRAAIVLFKNHDLISTSDNERAWPIGDQMDDSMTAVPKSAMHKFSRNSPTARENFATVLPRLRVF